MKKNFVIYCIAGMFIFLSFNTIGIPIDEENKLKNNNPIPYKVDIEGEYYALIVGCSKYENHLNNLPKPPFKPFEDEKILYIYESLISSKNWKQDNIVLLLNEEATKSNITDSLLYFSEIITPEDTFLFQWCGHGTLIPDEDGDESYYNSNDIYDEVICPYDTHYINDSYQNVLSDDELDFYFSKIDSKGMCLIFESCYSGGLVSIDDEDINNYNNEFIRDIKGKKPGLTDVNGDNRIIVMSTFPDNSSYGAFFRGFILIYSMANSFKKPVLDKNNDGFISVEEAYKFAKPLYRIESIKPIIPIWILITLYIKMDFYKWVYKVPILKRIYNRPIIKNMMEFIYGELNPLVSSTLVTIYSLIMVRNYFYNSGHMIKNYALISDNYPGDLNIIKYQ